MTLWMEQDRNGGATYGGEELPPGLSVETARAAAAMVGRWERSEGEFEEACNAVPLVIRLFLFLRANPSASSTNSTCTGPGGY